MITIPAVSTEEVKVPVSATTGGLTLNPTLDAVAFAFMAMAPDGSSADPGTGDWHTGSWETSGSTYLARCLVGPANAGVVLAVGLYAVWVRVSDNPEVPARSVGLLAIT